MIHDTHMHLWIPPYKTHCVTGTWAASAGQVANTATWKKTAAAETATLNVPIVLPLNDGPEKGAYLISVDVYFEILTSALTTLTAFLYAVTFPADTASFAAPVAQTFTYDTNHATAGNRVLVDQHTMTLTLTAPLWVPASGFVQMQMSLVCAVGSVFDFIGCRANYTFRL